MDPDDLELFERSVRHAVSTHTGTELDSELNALGWSEALAEATPTAVSTLFERQGFENATSSALTTVLAHSLGSEIPPAAGIVLPALGCCSPPGTLVGGSLAVHGLGMGSLAGRERAIVAAGNAGHEVAYVVPLSDLDLSSVQGLDPQLGLVTVAGNGSWDGVQIELTPNGWTSAVALAQLATGHELVGASTKMLELARQHAVERVQFGRSISKFQAVRHRLAETLVAVESAKAALSGAWDDGSPQTAAMAKAVAGRSARTVARHCQQVLGGIGFTTEHEFHCYVRRIVVLDELFGSTRSLTAELGSELLTTHRLPPPGPL